MSGRVQGSRRSGRLAGFGVAFAFCIGAAAIVAAIVIIAGAPVWPTIIVAALVALLISVLAVTE